VLRQVSMCIHAVATTPAESLAGSSLVITSSDGSLPSVPKVGFRISIFEACSAFTRITAYMLAGSPKATLTIGGFGCFVTSTTGPTATGWSDSCQAGLAPAEDLRLSTAHGTDTLFIAHACFSSVFGRVCRGPGGGPCNTTVIMVSVPLFALFVFDGRLQAGYATRKAAFSPNMTTT